MAAFLGMVWNGFCRVLDGSIFVARERHPPIGGHCTNESNYGVLPSQPPKYEHLQFDRLQARYNLKQVISPASLFVLLSREPISNPSELVAIVDAYCQNQRSAKFAPSDIVDLILKFSLDDPCKVCL